MAEYIKREALRKVLENWRNAHADVDDEEGCGLLEDVICEVDAQLSFTAGDRMILLNQYATAAFRAGGLFRAESAR